MTAPKTPHREVKEAFLLGNALKRGWTDGTSFHEMLASERARVSAMPEAVLNHQITDKTRLRYYEKATSWTLVENVLALAECHVWPDMGQRRYMSGSVAEAAERFLRHSNPDDRLHAMIQFAKEGFFDELPIIVIRRKGGNGYRIDDGNHRAVALYLAGERLAKLAFVGVVPPP